MHSMHGASGIWSSIDVPSNIEDLLILFLYLWPAHWMLRINYDYFSAPAIPDPLFLSPSGSASAHLWLRIRHHRASVAPDQLLLNLSGSGSAYQWRWISYF